MSMPNGLTIGQAAAFAGVTIKTVRHYHRLGLVDEPSRDGSGYRRYGSAELLQLVRTRTLAQAGVPLADIPALIDADPDRFKTAIAEVDRRLADHIAELVARRETLGRLDSGDRALLPDKACVLLDRLRGLGFGAVAVDMYRESLILARALFPLGFDDYLAWFDEALDDQGYVELLKLCWEAGDWPPDDPRLDDLAAAVADHMLGHFDLVNVMPELATTTDRATRYGLINHHGAESPTWDRLTELIETRLRVAGVDVPRQ